MHVKRPNSLLMNCCRLTMVFLMLWASMAACVGTAKKGPSPQEVGYTVKELKPLEPQPGEKDLEPGLKVVYFLDEYYRRIEQMPTGDTAVRRGRPGKPILIMNHQFKDGPVFDSGFRRGVGVEMTGLINLPEPGLYVFMAKSNDGVRIFIDQQVVVDDPTVHSDRYSCPTNVEINEPGWYSLRVMYFQRKGTAALGLLWLKPGDRLFEVVPAEAYAHRAD